MNVTIIIVIQNVEETRKNESTFERSYKGNVEKIFHSMNSEFLRQLRKGYLSE